MKPYLYVWLFVGILVCTFSFAQAEERYLAPDPDKALNAARSLIEEDLFAQLVTVDADGRPRIRTMEHSGPDADMVIYLATIPTTRKLQQIRNNNKVTLLFDNPGETAYVTVMGTATIHTDEAMVRQHAWQSPAALAQFWPDFPANYVLIKVEPEWLEIIAPEIQARDEDWRPQTVVFPQ